MGARRKRNAGTSMIEFTLVGVPIIFVLLSTFEIARGMFIYHTVAYAAKEGTRYAAVHGATCAPPANNCLKTAADVAGRIRNASFGLIPGSMNVTFTPAVNGVSTKKLSEWLKDNTMWPPSGSNAPGQDVQIAVTYPFDSIACLVLPGTPTVSMIGTYMMPGAAKERIQF